MRISSGLRREGQADENAESRAEAFVTICPDGELSCFDLASSLLPSLEGV
jgi:hypothetical protein